MVQTNVEGQTLPPPHTHSRKTVILIDDRGINLVAITCT